jgi:hypothetical protein
MKSIFLWIVFVFLSPIASNAMLLLEIEGKVISFTDEWVTIDQGKIRYTLNRSKLRPEDSAQIKGANLMVSFVVDPDSVIEAHSQHANR